MYMYIYHLQSVFCDLCDRLGRRSGHVFFLVLSGVCCLAWSLADSSGEILVLTFVLHCTMYVCISELFS